MNLNNKTFTFKTIVGPHLTTFTLCQDHVDFEAFKRAFANEGWVDVVFMKDALSHEWWVRIPGGFIWEKSEKGKPNALPVTVLEW